MRPASQLLLRLIRLDKSFVSVWLFGLFLAYPACSWSELAPFAASPDQVLVIYNADWKKRSEGSTADQDSLEVAEYYVKMHTDPNTGKKPNLLGLSCKHFRGSHLNNWLVKEDSNDNANGVIFKGKGPSPQQSDWLRDSSKVEIQVTDPNTDWDSLSIKCRSELSGEEAVVTPLRVDFKVSGIPGNRGDNASYPPVENGKGRCFRFDASKLFPGTVTVNFSIKNRDGKVIRDLSLRYYDIRDFIFSPTGPDGIPDDRILEEDVLQPVRKYLEDPANSLPDGMLLRDHILYIVVVHGMPHSTKAVFGIEHGATRKKGDHGSLASLEQRLQTLYYGWESMRPPVISMYMAEGPDSSKGVVNNIITTAMRYPLSGPRWNRHMHPNTYSFIGQDRKTPPFFHLFPPFPERRQSISRDFFIYSVSRIDASTVEEAKRLIDYAIYATHYLRPEMDCVVRSALAKKGDKEIMDLAERLQRAEKHNLWGHKELEILGFRVISDYEGQGVPFMVRPSSDPVSSCKEEKSDWSKSGFYPGGMDRGVVSHNGWNMKTAPLWKYLKQGVTVTACGAPAYDGGPHITNATFWDNRILMRYLFRGRDLGEAFLLSTFYINWSTSLIGDPLLHPDLRKTVIDRTPPKALEGALVTFVTDRKTVNAEVRADVDFDAKNPEVAVLKVAWKDTSGKGGNAVSAFYSRRPQVTIQELAPDTGYTFAIDIIDPYGNSTALPTVTGRTPSL